MSDYDLLSDLQPSLPQQPSPPVKKTFFEELEEEADKLGGRYFVLYPKFMLSVYYRVHLNRWSFELGGNPESFIDQHLGDWIRKLPHKDLYLELLNNSLKLDKDLFNLLCLRMNYALVIGKEAISGDIKIFKNKSGHLLFHEKTKVIGEETVYDGDLESAKLKDEEIEEWANKFYSNSSIISQSKSGLPEHILFKINEMLNSYGYKINEDREEVYRELNRLNKIHIESGLVARVAFLVLINSIGSEATGITHVKI